MTVPPLKINSHGRAHREPSTPQVGAPSSHAEVFQALGIKPSDDAIRMRAHQIYLERLARGLPDRAPELNWHQAERELRGTPRRAAAAAA